MSDFYAVLDDYLGADDSLEDIRVTVRRCWFYDFIGYPLNLWQGQGKLYTADGREWLGTMTGDGGDLHKTPAIQDGRDGSSATYQTSLVLVDIPGQTSLQAYEALKGEQWRVNGQKLTCYFVLFGVNEGLRPATPIAFFKELVMFSPKFSEKITSDDSGKIIKSYTITVTCKDGNFGRSNIPGLTYSDTVQKAYAKTLGVPLDRGCEYLAALANRTYQPP